jgi:hypothetical protein
LSIESAAIRRGPSQVVEFSVGLSPEDNGFIASIIEPFDTTLIDEPVGVTWSFNAVEAAFLVLIPWFVSLREIDRTRIRRDRSIATT